jgi:hypothetical protein
MIKRYCRDTESFPLKNYTVRPKFYNFNVLLV